jgi:cysteine sulfinate desulfinase/cysteine desulfurase-like protein
VINAIRKICKRNGQEEGSLRISLGRDTKKSDIDKFISVLTKILNKYNKWVPLEK